MTDRPTAGRRSTRLANRRTTERRRVLVTGLSTFWGGRVAQALEEDPSIEVIVGLDTDEPTVELERTEYVRVDANYTILARIVKAAQIDTIIHTFLVVDPTQMSRRSMHEVNVIGTMNLFAAASTPDSTVRDVIVKSSTVVYGAAAEDPVWFTEDTPSSGPARAAVERSLDAVEGYVRDFADDNPHVNVALLRFSNVIGEEIETPLTRALQLPLVPTLAGFDPRFQFVHEHDVIRSILFALESHLVGVYNVAGDGLLPWSESAAIAGRRTIALPPFLTSFVTLPLARLGIVDLPEDYLALLRYGRGVDNRKLKELGFTYEYTSAQAVQAFAEAIRLRNTVGDHQPAYRYERDVEQFFRHSPAVVRDVTTD
jgi:UDP-glucose 4-epimerase